VQQDLGTTDADLSNLPAVARSPEKTI
jgi:hypothetical protein